MDHGMTQGMDVAKYLPPKTFFPDRKPVNFPKDPQLILK
jgi:hypothetical protein